MKNKLQARVHATYQSKAKSSQACARLVKVRRELVFRRPAVRVQFYEVVQAVSEGCRFQQEELDDEEADLKREVSWFQANNSYTFILKELRVHL